MEIELLNQPIGDVESAAEIDQYLSDLEGLVDNTDGSEGDPPEPSKSVRRPSLRARGCDEHSSAHCNKENP